MSISRISAVCVAVVLAVSVGAQAAVDATWDNDTGGDFHIDDNWLGNDAPDQDDDTAAFNLAGSTYTVTFAGGETNATLTVGSTNIVTFDLNTNTYALTGDVTVGTGADGAELKITDGTLTCDNLNVNYQNYRGTVSIESGGAITCNTATVGEWYWDYGTLNVGVVGTGTLHVDTGLCRIGGGNNPACGGDTGYMNVGAGGTVTCDERCEVQDGGVLTLSGGTMYITDGQYSSGWIINGDLSIWGDSGDDLGGGILKGSGTLDVNGAGSFTVWNGGVISPGTSIGTITITNGDLVCDTIQNSWKAYDGTLELEFDDTSCDLIKLTTAGRSIDLTDATLDFSTTIGGGEIGQHDFLTADTISGFDDVTSDNMDTLMTDLGYVKDTTYTYGVVDDGGTDTLRLTYVPEPATMGLLCIGGVLVLLRRRRK